MKIEMHDAAEIQAVAMEGSFREPVVQAALATELRSEELQTAAQPQQHVPNKRTTVWQALSHGAQLYFCACGLIHTLLADRSPCFVCAAWDVADEHLANWFGLNESKYEWAVREYYWQQRQEKEQNELLQSSSVQVRCGHIQVCLQPTAVMHQQCKNVLLADGTWLQHSPLTRHTGRGRK